MLSLKIESVDGCAVFNGGGFVCDDPSKFCKLALDICTYKKEEQVIGNLRKLSCFASEIRGAYSENVSIFLVDNGRTLASESLRPEVNYFPNNNNLGGSGGFARGLYEIRKTGGYDRVVFMDDDVEFDPESVYRLWSFSSMLRPEYEDIHICGAMLRSDSRNIIYESTANLGASKLQHVLGDTDVSDTRGCLDFNDVPAGRYGGWWMCCSPEIGEHDFPLPFFIIFDDVEYGLRYVAEKVMLNGVSVWADSLDEKHFPSRKYLACRNGLVTYTLYGDLKAYAKGRFNRALAEAFSQRYAESKAVTQGMRDFIRGPEKALDSDIHEMLSKLNEGSPEIRDFDRMHTKSALEFERARPVKSRSKLWIFLTLNGALLPCKGTRTVHVNDMNVSGCYRCGGVTHYLDGGWFTTSLDRSELLGCVLHATFAYLLVVISSKRQHDRFSNAVPECRSESYWKRFF